MYPKLITLIVTCILLVLGLPAQQKSITLEQCYQWAQQNYPLVQQLDLITQSTEYSIANVAKNKMPRTTIQGQASYQSDVTGLPISMPGVEALAKDQYKIYGDVYLPLTDRIRVTQTQKEIEASAAVQTQKVKVDIYAFKERINQIYFGILLLDHQQELLAAVSTDLAATLAKTEAAVKYGTATQANANLLLAQKLELEQQQTQNRHQRLAYLSMLAAITGTELDTSSTLSTPIAAPSSLEIQRPELRLFDMQRSAIDVQDQGIDRLKIPSLGLFFQGGYGRPALNFLSNQFDWYYIGGLRLSWDISQFYSSRSRRRLLDVQGQQIDNQRSLFMLQTQMKLDQTHADIAQYQSYLETDKELIKLRESIRQTAEVQLDNGLISALDYITYLTDEITAKQNLSIHQIQLLLAQYTQAVQTGQL